MDARLPLLATIVVFAVPLGAQQPAWRAGVGVAVITPEPPAGFHMAGLGDPEDKRISEGAHDDIYCRAIAISNGETTIALAVCDLIGLFYGDVQDIRSRVTGLPPERILIACTHVHSGPDTLGLWGPAQDKSGVDPDWLEFVRARSAAAIQQAVDSLEPVSLRLAEGTSPPQTSMNHNDPRIKDDTIAILQAVRPDGIVLATLVNWACHPEVLWKDSRQITSDYVHYLRDQVEADQGGVALCFNGALGGMVSPADEGRHTFEEAERIGRAVGAEVSRALTSATVIEGAVLRHARRQFAIPMDNAGLAALLEIGVIQRTEERPDGAVTTEVAALQLGSSQWVTFPGEAFPALGFLAKTPMDAPVKFLLGLAMDELGYLFPIEARDLPKYRYEQSMSINPAAATILLPQIQAVLAEVAGRD